MKKEYKYFNLVSIITTLLLSLLVIGTSIVNLVLKNHILFVKISHYILLALSLVFAIIYFVFKKKHNEFIGKYARFLFAIFLICLLVCYFRLIMYGIFALLELILPSSYTKIVTAYADQFFLGILYTLGISLGGTIIGFLIACVLGTLRSIKVHSNDNLFVKIVKKVVDFIIRLYVTVFRGTPMMVQAMIIYYGFVKIFQWSPVTAGLVIVSINTGAYLTEVIRNGIESVDDGQMEAARSLGFSYSKAMLLVIFPQAIKNSMAAIGNEFVINIKDTSVLNVIGCAEMYFILNVSASSNYKYMEQMIVGAIIYLILTLSTTKILHLIEKRLDVQPEELKGSN